VPCPVPFLNGRELEEKVKDICRDILNRPELIEAEVAERTGRTQETLQSIERQLAALDAKENKALNTETNLVVAKASGDASPEAYERALTRVKAQLSWIAEERQRLQAELDTVQKHERVALGLREARKRLLTNLERGTTQDWREILNALGVTVSVSEDGMVHIGMAIPMAENSIVCNTPMSDNEPLPACKGYVLSASQPARHIPIRCKALCLPSPGHRSPRRQHPRHRRDARRVCNGKKYLPGTRLPQGLS
jgi:hypothetical protein